MVVCYRCRDDGEVGGCPKCGKLPLESKVDLLALDDSDLYIQKLIPKYYRDIEFNPDELISSYNTLLSDIYFKKHIEVLDKLVKIFKSGILPTKSGLIISPKRFGKTIWAYSCIKAAYASGYTVFPMLDTQQIKRFLTLAVDKPKSEYIKGLTYSYEDFINADLVIISVVKDSGRYVAYEVIDQVLDMRSRNGKVTFFISEFETRTISFYDKEKRFESLFVNMPGADGLRYPGVISYSTKVIGSDQNDD